MQSLGRRFDPYTAHQFVLAIPSKPIFLSATYARRLTDFFDARGLSLPWRGALRWLAVESRRRKQKTQVIPGSATGEPPDATQGMALHASSGQFGRAFTEGCPEPPAGQAPRVRMQASSIAGPYRPTRRSVWE